MARADMLDELRSVMGGEFSEPFQVLLDGVVVYDSADDEVGCIFEKTFLMLGEDGEQVQSAYPRIQLHYVLTDAGIGEELSDKHVIRYQGDGDDAGDYPVRDVERDSRGLALVPLRKRED